MSSAPSLAGLPANPYTALQFHFGMLLGVEDLETLAAYPRGKMRLHNAWLHREGVVWGLGVELKPGRNEVQVAPGLALDAAGHELHLDTAACVNLGSWFDAHKDDPGFAPETTATGVRFDAHVVIRFKTCLSRPVPAISEPCEGASRDVAYSRVLETVELFLRPGLAPERVRPYRRLRLLFGLEQPRVVDGTPDPKDVDIIDRRSAIFSRPPQEQPEAFLDSFREYAALDTLELSPASAPDGSGTLFPALEPADLVLADIPYITLDKTATGWKLGEPPPAVIMKVRPSHVATATVQELLCGTLGGGLPDAGGPRVDPATVQLNYKTLTFSTVGKLAPRSFSKGGLSLGFYTEDEGWQPIGIQTPVVDAAGTGVTVELDTEPPVDARVRLVVRGTGPTPVLSEGPEYVPLAGGVGGPPGTASQGNDFTHMWTRS